MINLSQDIQPLSTFKRNTNELITQMRNTGHPIVLTINGKAELVVQDASSYQQLLNKIEELKTIVKVKKNYKTCYRDTLDKRN
jgi:prevent-host-death family protein